MMEFSLYIEAEDVEIGCASCIHVITIKFSEYNLLFPVIHPYCVMMYLAYLFFGKAARFKIIYLTLTLLKAIWLPIINLRYD